MQSEYLAISPNLICSYVWKVPAGRPAIFERAQSVMAPSEDRAARTDHPSIPWKAYLASREFQHLASDLAEAIFAERLSLPSKIAARPAILSEAARATTGLARGLLLPALADGAVADEPRAIAA